MSDIAVRAEVISKKYRISPTTQAYDTLRDRIAEGVRALWRRRSGSVHSTIWALRGVSFEIPKGAIVGIIGRNGAGKTTLLKILSRVTAPTTGRAQITGRLGSLLEVGTGFHPELTGRENVYLSGAILGMTKREIDRKFDEIISFAEVEQFVDTPVKRYSTGMAVRLGFSVAAHLEPDTLLVDEVLAVGDARFWSKSVEKMRALNAQGMTILLVTHSMWFVQTICSRAICLERGRILADGSPLTVIGAYRQVSHRIEAESTASAEMFSSPGGVRLTLFQVFPEGKWLDGKAAAPDAGLRAVMGAEVNGLPQIRFLLRVTSPDGFPYFTVYSDPVENPRSGYVECEASIRRLMLMPGDYHLWGAVCGPGGEDELLAEEYLPFSVRGDGREDPRYGVFWNRAQWRIHRIE